MRISVWGVALVALVVWSLLAWGGHALLDLSSDWAAANADKISSVPDIVEWASWGFRSLGNASEIVVMIAWAVGVIPIVGAAIFISWLLSGRKAGFAKQKTWRG